MDILADYFIFLLPDLFVICWLKNIPATESSFISQFNLDKSSFEAPMPDGMVWDLQPS